MCKGFTGQVEDCFGYTKCPANLDMPIYRYMKKERFLEMVEKGINVFAHLSLWEDPYEAFLLRSAISHCRHMGDVEGERSLYDEYKFVYGQSWTTSRDESDLLWRANGGRGEVVRVQTTVRKLFEIFQAAGGASGEKARFAEVQMGEVEYVDRTEIDRIISNPVFVKDVLRNRNERMRLFFKKRTEFKGEAEFRCLFVVRSENCIDMDTDSDGSLMKFRMDSRTFFDGVLLDPCMGRRECEQLICRTLYRCPDLKVEQSELFTWPEIPVDAYGREFVDSDAIPGLDRLVAHLAGKRDDNVRAIITRIQRVLRARGYDSETPPSPRQLDEWIDRMDEIIPNEGSAADCKTALRHYKRALYGKDND